MPMPERAATTGERFAFVTIQARPVADVVDTSGAPTDDAAEVPWTDLVATMPAAKSEVSGRERFTAQQVQAPYDTRWKIHYRADMDPDLLDVPKLRRLVFNGRVLDIVSAALLGRREGVELLTLGKP